MAAPYPKDSSKPNLSLETMEEKLLYFSFRVKGWLNDATVSGTTEEEAWDAACSMAAGASNIYGWNQLKLNMSTPLRTNKWDS